MGGRTSKKLNERTRALRLEVFGDIDESLIWSRKRHRGFTTIPRTMPLVHRIMDALSTGKPLSSTYLDLWCLVFDESFLQIKNPAERAFFAGFSGTRAVYSWNQRMKRLVDLGFIRAEVGASGPYEFVLLLNPHVVIHELKAKRPPGFPDDVHRALVARMSSIGADDYPTDEGVGK